MIPYDAAMDAALAAAARFRGATAPNPCVGAAIIDAEGRVLALGAHERAGAPHAEVHALRALRESGRAAAAWAIVVTLEPCNHTGRTGPCTEAILAAGIPRVVLGARDPNPRAAGGVERLRAAGVEVIEGVREQECRELIGAFRWRVRTGRPWVTVKTAWTRDGGMIPPVGRKTFTSPESLRLAHGLRKRADAILTGSGTILADDPSFTVRHVPDHPGKRRWLAVLDRRLRVPEAWLERARTRGLDPFRAPSVEAALDELGRRGCLEVLVEAGPGVSGSILSGSLWNEQVRITQGAAGEPDQVSCLRGSPGPNF